MKHLNDLKAINGKPLRYRAEIMIWRDGKVLVTSGQHGAYEWYGLPGGGIDEGESPEEAARREALEEVGVAVRNTRLTGEVHIGPNPPGLYGARARMYGGVHTTLVRGDFERIDRSLLGIEGDAVQYLWMTPAEAHKVFADNYQTNSDSGKHRVNEIAKYL